MSGKIDSNIAIYRFIACFLVVCLHVWGGCANSNEAFSYIVWYMGAVAIPIFFLTSGYFILGKEVSIKKMLNKSLNIIAFMLLWCLPFSILLMVRRGEFTNPFNDFIQSFFQEGFFARYWFFWELIIIQMLAPLISKMMKGKKLILISSLLTALCFASHIINIVTIIKTGHSIYSYEYNEWLRQTYKVWIFATYFLIGGILRKDNVKEWIRRKIRFQYIVIMTVILGILSIIYQYEIGKIMNYNAPEYHHDSIIIILFVLCMSIMFTCYDRVKVNESILKIMSSCTLAIYCIHGWVQMILKKFIGIETIPQLIIHTVLVFGISFVIYMVLNKIFILKYFVTLPRIKFIKDKKS